MQALYHYVAIKQKSVIFIPIITCSNLVEKLLKIPNANVQNEIFAKNGKALLCLKNTPCRDSKITKRRAVLLLQIEK